MRQSPPSLSVAPRPLSPSPTTYPLPPTFLGHIHKFLLSFCKDPIPLVRNHELHNDPLNFPATPHLPPNDATHAVTQE
ncbi:hypothetical protein M405DRAFT_868766 [Rhizopogon salebrosus TDB-379]|nr:hypothetical protein M405DRAFT_868766 [Rhizopogon salebrosus TDB-379]